MTTTTKKASTEMTTTDYGTDVTKEIEGMSKKEAIDFLQQTHPEMSNIKIAEVLNCNSTYVSQIKSKLRGGPKTTKKKTTPKSKKSTTTVATKTRKKRATTKAPALAKKAPISGTTDVTNLFELRRNLQAMCETVGMNQLKAVLSDIEQHG